MIENDYKFNVSNNTKILKTKRNSNFWMPSDAVENILRV